MDTRTLDHLEAKVCQSISKGPTTFQCGSQVLESNCRNGGIPWQQELFQGLGSLGPKPSGEQKEKQEE